MRHAFFGVVLASALPLLSCVDADKEPLQPTRPHVAQVAQEGAYAVGFTYYMLHDATRGNRAIAVYLWYPVKPSSVTAETLPAQYPLEPFANTLPVASSLDFEEFGLGAAWQEAPAAKGPFPLIMYSPGWNNTAYTSAIYLATEIVRHGFVLAAVTHWGDRGAPVLVPGEPYDHLALALHNRPRDISFTLTDVLEKSAASTGLLSGIVDASTIYASGWSLGGYAAMVLAAGDDDVCELAPPGAPPEACGPTPADPRITGIIPLDGSSQLLHFADLARVRVPTLALGQEWTNVLDWHARAHAAYSGSPSYRVDVARVVHQSFSNLCEAFQVAWKYGITPRWGQSKYNLACLPPTMPYSETHRIVIQYILAFLTHRQSVLTPGFALINEPDVEFFVTERRSPSSIDDEYPSTFIYFMHQPGRGHGDVVTAIGEKEPQGPRPTMY